VAWPGANRYADWYAAHATDHAAMATMNITIYG
jgi:hypothetical protein